MSNVEVTLVHTAVSVTEKGGGVDDLVRRLVKALGSCPITCSFVAYNAGKGSKANTESHSVDVLGHEKS